MKEYKTIEDAKAAKKRFNDLYKKNGFPKIQKDVYRIENGNYISAGPIKAAFYTRNTTPII